VKGKRSRGLQLFRHSLQAIVALYVLVLVIANNAGETWAANLHTICPFGGVVNLYTYLSDGGYVAKLHSAVFIMLLALIIGLVLTGKSFCGWICPLGSVQEALGGIGRRLWPRAYNKVPRRLEQALRLLKWAVLAWVLVQTARSAQLLFQDWDPYYNLFRIWTDEIAITGYVVTGITLLASLFIPRPFSRYACPLGAFNGLFNSFSFLGIRRDAKTCTDCGRCAKVCPVNIDPSATATVWSIECTRCLKCVEVCPQNSRDRDTLRLHTWFGRFARSGRVGATAKAAGSTRRRAVPTIVFAGIAVAAFVLPILIANLSGDFAITRGGGGGGGGKSSVEPDADTSTEDTFLDIRGSTTLEEVKATVDDFPALLVRFGIPEDAPLGTKLKDLAAQYGFEVEEIRAYLAETIP
jgi:polyferredoxin